MTVKVDTKALHDMVKRGLWFAGDHIIGQLKKSVAIDTGEHRNRITYTVYNRPNVWPILKIHSDTWQAVIDEFGRKAWKMPPLDSLVWRVIRHFWLPGKKTGKYDTQPFETKRAVRSVARAIGRRWIKARKTYSKTIQKEANNIILAFKKWLS